LVFEEKNRQSFRPKIGKKSRKIVSITSDWEATPGSFAFFGLFFHPSQRDDFASAVIGGPLKKTGRI
jgi:hypothetical protein